MPRQTDPSDMSPETLMTRLINAGLQLARNVGLGLGLVNELRDKYPDIPQSTIGQAASTIGQGIRAALEAQAAPLGTELPIESMPVMPAPFFHGDEEERIVAMADVPWEGPGVGEGETWDVRYNCGEGLTFQELIDCITAHFEEGPLADYPDAIARIVNSQIAVYFMGKRF